LLQAVLRYSSVAFTAMVVIVGSGMVQGWRQLGSLQALGQTAYGRLLVAKVVVFLLLIAVAGQSRTLVRRRLTARVLVAPAAPGHHAEGAALAGPGDGIDTSSPWLLRRLVLAEVIIAIVVLAVTALLGVATPPRGP
jgi:copper transport protein